MREDKEMAFPTGLGSSFGDDIVNASLCAAATSAPTVAETATEVASEAVRGISDRVSGAIRSVGGAIQKNPGTTAMIAAGALGAGAVAWHYLAREDKPSESTPARAEAPSSSEPSRPSRPGVRMSGSLFRHTIASGPAARIVPAIAMTIAPRTPTELFCQHVDDLPGIDAAAKNMFKNAVDLLNGCRSDTITPQQLHFLLGKCGSDTHFSLDTVLDKVAERSGKTRASLTSELHTGPAKKELVKAALEEIDSWTHRRYGITSEEIDHQVYELLTNPSKRTTPFAGRNARHNGLSRYFEALGLIRQRAGSHSLPTTRNYPPSAFPRPLSRSDLTGDLRDIGIRMQTALNGLTPLFNAVNTLQNPMNPTRARNRDIHHGLEHAGREMGGYDLKGKVLSRVAEKMDITPSLAVWIVAFPENANLLMWAVGDAVDEWLSTEIGVTSEEFNAADARIYASVSEKVRSVRDEAEKARMETEMSADPLWAQNNRRTKYFSFADFFALILQFLRIRA